MTTQPCQQKANKQSERERDRDVKEDRDDRDRRENGTSGDDRKGEDQTNSADLYEAVN